MTSIKNLNIALGNAGADLVFTFTDFVFHYIIIAANYRRDKLKAKPIKFHLKRFQLKVTSRLSLHYFSPLRKHLI